MSIEELHEQIRQHAKSGVVRVFNGTLDIYASPCICANDITQVLMDLGAESLEDIETNGWQNDYWETWTYNGQRYRLSGSGHFGNAKFQKDDA